VAGQWRAPGNERPSRDQHEGEGSTTNTFWGLGALDAHRVRPAMVALLAIKAAAAQSLGRGTMMFGLVGSLGIHGVHSVEERGRGPRRGVELLVRSRSA
jgi:hypothetical protein